MPQLSDFSKLENISNTFSGNSFSTLNSLTVTERNTLDKLLGNWPDGKPASEGKTDAGDGTVTSLSAKLEKPNISNFSFDLNHEGLISNSQGLQKIFDILGRTLSSGTYDSLKNEEIYLVFYVHSPVKISSPDTQSGDFISDEMIIIPNPQNKDYTLSLKGLENNFYSLSIGQIFKDQVNWNDYYGEAKTGITQTFKFSINPLSINENPLIDPLGNNTKDQLKARIKEFRGEIEELKVDKRYKKFLLDHLSKIEKEKNQENGLLLTRLLRNTLTSYRFQKVLSTETTQLFRKKTLELSSYFEYLAFLKPRKANKQVAQVAIKISENTFDNIFKNKTDKFDKFSGLIILEGQEKLGQAKSAFEKGEYFQAFIYSSEATDLFLEAKTGK